MPAVWARAFERAAITTSVLVISAAWVTQRSAPVNRTAALAGLWSGVVVLAGLGWAATAAGSGLARLARRARGRRFDPARGGDTAATVGRPRNSWRDAVAAQIARAVGLAVAAAAVVWSRRILVPTWAPLCLGLVEGLAVAVVYRLATAYRMATAPRRDLQR